VLGSARDGGGREDRQRAAAAGFKEAVHERDDPFGDFGSSPSGVTEQ
jgi:hypothetical protein